MDDEPKLRAGKSFGGGTPNPEDGGVCEEDVETEDELNPRFNKLSSIREETTPLKPPGCCSAARAGMTNTS